MSDLTTPATRIAVLDRGFVYVGQCAFDGDVLTITGAQCVRRWGTSAGLGELAAKGPLPNTQLDATGTVRAPARSVIHLIDCNAEAWPSVPA